MKEYLDLIALRTGYIYILGSICLILFFISLIIIGRCQYLMKRFGREYYPARKYQEKNLFKYDISKDNVYIRSYYLYKKNPELKMDKPQAKYMSYRLYKFINSLSISNNVILIAPDIHENENNRTLYKYIQYIKFQKLPISRIIIEIPDNVKLKEVSYNERGLLTEFNYLVKER